MNTDILHESLIEENLKNLIPRKFLLNYQQDSTKTNDPQNYVENFKKKRRGDVAVYGIPGVRGSRYTNTAYLSPGTGSLRTRHRHPTHSTTLRLSL